MLTFEMIDTLILFAEDCAVDGFHGKAQFYRDVVDKLKAADALAAEAFFTHDANPVQDEKLANAFKAYQIAGRSNSEHT